MHNVKEMVPRAPAIIIARKIKYPLRFIVSYVRSVTQHYESRTVQKAPLQSTHTTSKKEMDAPGQLYQLSFEK